MISSFNYYCKRQFSSKRIRVSADKRTNILFGANTDVGKSVVSAGLVQAPSKKGGHVHYIKPLQCGGSDQAFVQKYLLKSNNNVKVSTLFQWETPTSPHMAARREGIPVSDAQVRQALTDSLAETTHRNEPVVTYIETAGGVLSPSSSSPENTSPKHACSNTDHWGWMPQADLYQPLLGQLPVVLVGDGRLGGISATLSSLESLIIRGYDVAAVVVLERDGYDCVSALREYASRKLKLRAGSGEALFHAPHQSIVSLPPVPEDINIPLDDWFASNQVSDTFAALDEYLQQSWEGQVDDLKGLRSSGRKVLWWPFTQHGNIETDQKVTLIDSAAGDSYHVLTGQGQDLERSAQFDACASWWTQGVGHGESSMALASAAAAGRYGHTIFPDVVHAPSVALSQKLLGPTGPGNGWADRVFFTDDGSTAMEVAMKMGFKTFFKRHEIEDLDDFDWSLCAQLGCYHGDTLGVMDVAEPSIFNEKQHPWYEPRSLYLKPSILGFRDGALTISFPEFLKPNDICTYEFDSIQQALDVEARMLSSLFTRYTRFIEGQWAKYEYAGVWRKIGCVIIEPILMGAGGMKFVDPLFQRALMEVAKSKGVPVVFDEVASGLHRVGVKSCREILKCDPDIAAYAKLLTGGLIPMSVTLASNEVFESFLGDEKSEALLHGHSYTAHPVGCLAALHALEAYHAILEKGDESNTPRMLFDEAQTRELSLLPLVQESFTMGTVLAVTIQPEDGVQGYAAASRTLPIVQKLRENGVFARPLGNVIYIMASPLTSKEECSLLLSKLAETIKAFGEK